MLQQLCDATLKGVEVVDVERVGVDWSSVDVEQARVLGVCLRGAQLRACSLTDVAFERCDLSGMRFEDGSLTRVSFTACRMEGVTFAASSLFDVLALDCKLALSNFRFLKKLEAQLEGCSLREADFTGSDLRKLALVRCDCTSVDFTTAQLEGADLRSNQLLHLRGVAALRGATLDHAQLIDLLPQLAAEAGIVLEAQAEAAARRGSFQLGRG